MAIATEEEAERFKFLCLFSSDLNTARHSIKLIEDITEGSSPQLQAFRVPLFRDAVVAYSRPFTANKAVHITTRKGKKHSLTDDDVPTARLAIHKRLVQLRNTLFAHSDAKFHDVRLMRIGGGIANTLKGGQLDQWLANLPEVSALIEEVEAGINKRRETMSKDAAILAYVAQFDRLPLGTVEFGKKPWE